MTTPVYGFPIPLLSSIADGPDAISDLAYRVEREMTGLRAVSNYSREQNTSLSNVAGVPVHTTTTPLVVIGWVEVEVEVFLGSLVAESAFIAGNIWLDLNGVRARTIRYHNQGLTKVINPTFTGTLGITAADTSLTAIVSVAADPVSSGHLYHRSSLAVRQYGAPSSG